MARTRAQIDDDTIALLDAIWNHDSVFEAEITTAYGLFRHEYDTKSEESRWTLDVSDIVRDGSEIIPDTRS